MTKYDVFFCSKILVVEWLERLNQYKINKVKKKNAPTTNRSVLGGPVMLASKQDKYSASIWDYQNIYNIFVGHMPKIITFDTFHEIVSPPKQQNIKGVKYV